MEFLYWKLTGESPLFSQKCAKNRLEICLARIIMCKTIASPTLRCVMSRALLLIYITVLRSRTEVLCITHSNNHMTI